MGIDFKKRLTQFVETGFLPTDGAELRLKKTALTLMPLIIGTAAFIWGSIYFLLGHPLSGSIPMSYAIVSAASLAYFFKTRRIGFLQHSQLLLVLLLPFLLMWTLGGFAASSMVMIWAIFAPIVALLFLEKRNAMGWFLAYVVLTVISTLIDDTLVETVTPLPPLAIHFFYLLNMGCGSAGLYLLVSYSTTEQKQAIAALAHGNQLLAGHMNSTPMAAISWDRNFRVTAWNPAAEKIFGYTREEAMGRHAADLIVPHDIAEDLATQVFQPLLSRSGGTRSKNNNVTKAGQRLVCDWYNTPVADRSGNIVEIFSLAQDITQQETTRLALADSEARFKDFTDTASDWVWEMDAALRFSFLSDSYERAMFIKPAHLLGKTRWEFSDPVTSGLSLEAWQAHRLTLEKHQPFRELQYQTRGGDGLLRTLSVSGNPVFDASGNFRGYRGTGRDTTRLVAAQHEMERALEEAKKANLAKSEFLSSMSHELRTPMNAILGFGQLMEYDERLPAELQDNVQEILKAGHHLLGLINEVLDLAKIESGRIDMSLEPVEVAALVDDCLGLVGTLADQGKIQIHCASLDGAVVCADRTRLKQALLNLLSNAIKYNRAGGSVMLDVQAAGAERLRIRVRDTGHGIAAEHLPELFQPFKRLDADSGSIEGTGIGLTITRRLVEMMGGSVEVTSEHGVGSTFWIELPKVSETLPASTSATGAGTGNVPQADIAATRHTVLYIEDNPSNTKLVAKILAPYPHLHLLTTPTPELGIELARSRAPDLILLDINMPGMDGYQVLQVLRADARTNAIPVIAVTANAMPRDIERGMAAGFYDYLTKPIDVGQFMVLIERTLQESNGREKTHAQ